MYNLGNDKTIDEEVYIEQPKGFEVNRRDSHVYKVNKAIYGLKQYPRAWYTRMHTYLLINRFMNGIIDSNIYIKVLNSEPNIILLYVDDLFITSVEQKLEEFKKMLATEFEMKDLGLVHYYLCLEVWQKPKEI